MVAFIYCSHSASWYLNICFSSCFQKHMFVLQLHTRSERLSSGNIVFVWKRLVGSDCTFTLNAERNGHFDYVWWRTSVPRGHTVSLELLVLLAQLGAVLKSDGSFKRQANCIFCTVSYLGLLKSSRNSFTSGKTGEDSASSTLLRTTWVQGNGHPESVVSPTFLPVCVLNSAPRPLWDCRHCCKKWSCWTAPSRSQTPIEGSGSSGPPRVDCGHQEDSSLWTSAETSHHIADGAACQMAMSSRINREFSQTCSIMLTSFTTPKLPKKW